MAKVLRTLRTHWKKSIFFGGVSAYGLKYAKDKFDEKQMMKRLCKEALAYGEPPVPVSYVSCTWPFQFLRINLVAPPIYHV
jgi:hypothetical protein